MARKIRVYELARELGLTNKEALDLCIALGIGVKSHSSSIEDAQADRVRRKADSEGLRREQQPEEPEKPKLFLFPFQITVAPATHANSREQFFEEYGWWIEDLSKFDVDIQFLWITPECRDSQEYPAKPERKWPKHLERYIPFKDVDKEIGERYENAQKRVLKDEAAKKKLLKNKATIKKAGPQKAAKGRHKLTRRRL